MNESISMLKLTIIAALGVITAYFNALMIPIVVLVFVMVTDYISEEVGRVVKQHRHYGHRQKGRVPRSRRRRYGCRLPDFLGACARRYRDTDKLLLCYDHRHMADRQRADIYSREPRRARRADSRFSPQVNSQNQGRRRSQNRR